MPGTLKETLPPAERKMLEEIDHFYLINKKEIEDFFYAKEISEQVLPHRKKLAFDENNTHIEAKLSIEEKTQISISLKNILSNHREFLERYYGVRISAADPLVNLKDLFAEMTEKEFAQTRELFIAKTFFDGSIALEHYAKMRCDWEKKTGGKPHPDHLFTEILKKDMESKIEKARLQLLDAKKDLESHEKYILTSAQENLAAEKLKSSWWQRLTDADAKQDYQETKTTLDAAKRKAKEFKKNIKEREANMREVTAHATSIATILKNTRETYSSTGIIAVETTPRSSLSATQSLSTPSRLSNASDDSNSAPATPSNQAPGAPITVTFHRKKSLDVIFDKFCKEIKSSSYTERQKEFLIKSLVVHKNSLSAEMREKDIERSFILKLWELAQSFTEGEGDKDSPHPHH